MFVVGIVAFFGAIFGMPATKNASALSCPELKIVFARGSGAEKDTNDNFLEFKKTIEEKIGGWGIPHDYTDLDYTAIGVGADNLDTLIGAFFGAGEAYDFGASVDDGVEKLSKLVSACPNSKFVLGGYSQGAMVVSRAIHSLPAEKIIYAATFGDPKIYLPEGRAWGALTPFEAFTESSKNVFRTGIIPAACKNKNLSDYRMYVPDCYTYEGLLGSYQPYEPAGYSGKLGTWCNKTDIFCSSYLSVSSHVAYISDKLYEDASRVIAKKVGAEFGVKDEYVSAHDTVFMIDSTNSMTELIEQYKKEALNLARKTLDSGGRVALFDYKDKFFDNVNPYEYCNFDTCTLETFERGLNAITLSGGADDPESLLHGSMYVMRKLNWSLGATKSMIVLTDATYHTMDADGTTLRDVVKLSKQIDPVNFYIITPEKNIPFYQDLASQTDGAAVSSASDLSLLTEMVVNRYDSLPRVEEDEEFDGELPVVAIREVVDNNDSVMVRFLNSGTKVMVFLNDAFLGVTQDDSVVIDGLNRKIPNTVRLVPINETRRGNGVNVEIRTKDDGDGNSGVSGVGATGNIDNINSDDGAREIKILVPKAPNTGRR